MFASICRAGMIFLLLTSAAVAADGFSAIATGGSGTLTMCRSWLLFSTCREYRKVLLPSRIVLGDRLPLNFGSNPKDYEFPVERIVRNDGSCTLLSEAMEPDEHTNRIEVSSCKDASGTH